MFDMLGMMPPEMVLDLIKAQLDSTDIDPIIKSAVQAYTDKLAARNEAATIYPIGMQFIYMQDNMPTWTSPPISLPALLHGAIIAALTELGIDIDWVNLPKGVEVVAGNLGWQR